MKKMNNLNGQTFKLVFEIYYIGLLLQKKYLTAIEELKLFLGNYWKLM